MEEKRSRYEEIIDHPHHVSKKRPQMPMHDRAAQFGSFKALTGYEESVEEAARNVGTRIALDDDRKAKLDMLVQQLCAEGCGLEITVIYFVPDKKKEGGAYVTAEGTFRRIDEAEGKLVMTDGERIPLCDIFDIEINGGNYNGQL